MEKHRGVLILLSLKSKFVLFLSFQTNLIERSYYKAYTWSYMAPLSVHFKQSAMVWGDVIMFFLLY